MRKNTFTLLTVILFCFSITSAKSQSLPLMTNAEIYDFNIGDIFERKVGGYSTPPTYAVDTIINKYYSVGMDTVFYVSNTYSYTYPACPPPCTGSSSYSLGNISYYTNLSDTVGKGLGKKPLDLNCIDTAGYTGIWMDSTYQNPNFCNRITTVIDFMNNGPVLYDTCFTYFEPYYGYDIYGKGLGFISHYYNTCSNGFPNCESGMQLVYYKKGNDSCGTFTPVIVTGITKLRPNGTVTIYPNPTNDFFTVKTNISGLQSLDLYDVNGRHLFTNQINGSGEVDITNLENGVYMLTIRNNTEVTNKKIIINR